jgi:hypothetical protein
MPTQIFIEPIPVATRLPENGESSSAATSISSTTTSPLAAAATDRVTKTLRSEKLICLPTTAKIRNPDSSRQEGPRGICVQPGCVQYRTSRNHCRKHDVNNYKYCSYCAYPECTSLVYARRYCKRHDVDLVEYNKRKKPQCAEQGCTSHMVVSRKRCRRHEHQQRSVKPPGWNNWVITQFRCGRHDRMKRRVETDVHFKRIPESTWSIEGKEKNCNVSVYTRNYKNMRTSWWTKARSIGGSESFYYSPIVARLIQQ